MLILVKSSKHSFDKNIALFSLFGVDSNIFIISYKNSTNLLSEEDEIQVNFFKVLFKLLIIAEEFEVKLSINFPNLFFNKKL